MKQKIKEALKQKYGTRANKELGQLQLGIGDEVFERVAASVETFITDEGQIEGFVNSDNTLNLLKSYQSMNDKLRAAEAKNEPTRKPSDDGNKPPVEPTKPQDTPDIAAIVAQAVATAVAPLQEKLTAFETASTQKSAVAALDELKATWDYAQGFPEESEYAYNMAMGIYNGIGKTWTAEQLTAKYKETFNERVGKKGIDTTKPFQSDGASGGEAELDMTEVMKIYQKSGRVTVAEN